MSRESIYYEALVKIAQERITLTPNQILEIVRKAIRDGKERV